MSGGANPSESARNVTEEIVVALAPEGWTVIGGLAKGIEITAHRTALAHGLPTVAALSSGFDCLSSQDHKLAQEILASGGVLISPFRLGFTPDHASKVASSRLQTALAAMLILTQGSNEDNAMYVARWAGKQGRPVFCTKPHEGDDADSGLRTLLNHPASQLHELQPAWKKRGWLAASLGDQPLATMIAPGDPDALRATLNQVVAAERENPPQPQWWPESNRRGQRI